MMRISLLILLTCFEICVHAQNLDHILGIYAKDVNELTGYYITAVETNTSVNQRNSILSYISTNTNLSRNAIQALRKLAYSTSDSETNVCFYTYRFGNNVSSISSKQYDMSGRLTVKSDIIATNNEIWEYHETYELFDSGRTNVGGWAEISDRSPNALFGIPIFLSRATIYNRITNSTIGTYERGNSLDGQACYIITMSGTPGAQVSKYKLFLDMDTLSPVELVGFSADGDMLTRTELQFDKSDIFPKMCKAAIMRTSSQMQSFWRRESIGKIQNDQSFNINTLIPPGTRVVDRRFRSKTLNYRMGMRQPNSNEFEMMSTNKFGVAIYEAATYHPKKIETNTPKNKLLWIRLLLIVFITWPFLVFLSKFLKKR